METTADQRYAQICFTRALVHPPGVPVHVVAYQSTPCSVYELPS